MLTGEVAVGGRGAGGVVDVVVAVVVAAEVVEVAEEFVEAVFVVFEEVTEEDVTVVDGGTIEVVAELVEDAAEVVAVNGVVVELAAVASVVLAVVGCDALVVATVVRVSEEGEAASCTSGAFFSVIKVLILASVFGPTAPIDSMPFCS